MIATLAGMATSNSNSPSGSWVLVVTMTITISARVSIISTLYEMGPRSLVVSQNLGGIVESFNAGNSIWQRVRPAMADRNPRVFGMRWLLCGVLIGASLAQDPNPHVDVAGGRLVGKTVDFVEDQFIGVNTKVDVYLGVPFADPPTRFAAPVAKTPWSGDWNATYYGDSCSHFVTDPTQAPASEDCLYLNVFAPNPQPTNADAMVYFPGGAFKFGGASNAKISGTSLAASSGVIVVTVGYRVGVFGVFTTGDDAAPGNYAMLDQIAALQWVHDNIHAFGGDRDRVTIFGQSAGAGSVGFLLLSPLAHGLFSRAIMQSGSALSPRYFRNDPETDCKEARTLASVAGCPEDDTVAMVTCLRTVDEIRLLEIQDMAYTAGYFIRVDGAFLTDTPANLMSRGEGNRPHGVMVGFNAQEGTSSIRGFYPEYTESETGPHIDRSTFETMVAATLLGSDRQELIADSVFQEYVDWRHADYPDADYSDGYVDYYGDYIWRSGSGSTLRHYVTSNVDDVYEYMFTHTPSSSFYRVGPVNPSWLRAGHTEEFQFVFGWSFDKDILKFKRELTDEEKALSAKMMRMWTNFAKTGNPTPPSEITTADPSLPTWPQFTVPELKYMDLSLNPTIRRAVRARGIAFWNGYIPRLRALLGSQTGTNDDTEEWRESFQEWQSALNEWRAVFNELTARTSD
ncbi:carboxylesterase 5A-like [Diadema setosum]|uniref:carboxylesterase 5A-like n=1 Tax=Diadema setosum TaxID=31175 RepID=UPI003B3B025F